MSRRFQFSLRALLGLAVFVCLVLGIRHLLLTYGQFVASQTAKIGQPVVVRGRLIRFLGPAELGYYLDAEEQDGVSKERGHSIVGGSAKRSWLCAYDIDERFQPADRPARYGIVLHADDGASALSCEVSIEP